MFLIVIEPNAWMGPVEGSSEVHLREQSVLFMRSGVPRVHVQANVPASDGSQHPQPDRDLVGFQYGRR